MYTRYAQSQRWRVEVLSTSLSGVGGLKEVIALVEGQKVYSKLKYESGVHRVQRVPETEQQGRIHTSAITVAVLPEADEVEIQIDPKDIRIDTFCSSGPGGQSVTPPIPPCASRTCRRESARAVATSTSGTKKTDAPARSTATVFCSTPPTSPTVPSGWIVPVAATVRPPVSSPPERLSMMPSVHASPAEGPPIWSLLMLTAEGKLVGGLGAQAGDVGGLGVTYPDERQRSGGPPRSDAEPEGDPAARVWVRAIDPTRKVTTSPGLYVRTASCRAGGFGVAVPSSGGHDVADLQRLPRRRSRVDHIDGDADVALGHGVAELAQRHRLGGELGLLHVHGALGIELRYGEVPRQFAGGHDRGGGVEVREEVPDEAQVVDAHVGEQHLPVHPVGPVGRHRDQGGHAQHVAGDQCVVRHGDERRSDDGGGDDGQHHGEHRPTAAAPG